VHASRAQNGRYWLGGVRWAGATKVDDRGGGLGVVDSPFNFLSKKAVSYQNHEGRTTMKKRYSIVFWLAVIFAGLFGQMAAFGLDASYSTNSTIQSSKFKISGFVHDSDVIYGTCWFFDDGTFDLYDGTSDYTGTYSLVNKGKKIAFKLDPDGLSAVEDMLTDWVQSLADDAGVQVDDLSFSFRKVTISQATISKKTGKPNKVTIKIQGTATASVDGSYKTRNFSYECVVTFL